MNPDASERTRADAPAKAKPVHEVRLGAIKAAVWKNETEGGPRYNVTFTRLYKEADQWRTTESFGRDDLLLLGKVADVAHTWICQQGQEEHAGANRAAATLPRAGR